MAKIRFSVKYNRMKKAFVEGFDITTDGVMTSQQSLFKSVYFQPIDTALEDNSFGRLCFDEIRRGNAAVSVYVAASNDLLKPAEETTHSYQKLYRELGAKRFVDIKDILLYEFTGRYLYIAFEVEGDGRISISNIKVFQQGDNFMTTFPEVYHDYNSFFHRYMSVFSSIYNDMDEEIEKLPELLDLDKADVSLLPIYGRWLGIDVGDGFLKEDVLRTLVKESYSLNRMKGTRYCLERISEIILGEKGIVVERNHAQDYLDDSQIEKFNNLYGNEVSDVTLLVKQSMDSITLSQFEYILKQFLPVNCSLHVVQLQNIGLLDGHVYLDINASVYKTGEGHLDSQYGLDGNVTLV